MCPAYGVRYLCDVIIKHIIVENRRCCADLLHAQGLASSMHLQPWAARS